MRPFNISQVGSISYVVKPLVFVVVGIQLEIKPVTLVHYSFFQLCPPFDDIWRTIVFSAVSKPTASSWIFLVFQLVILVHKLDIVFIEQDRLVHL